MFDNYIPITHILFKNIRIAYKLTVVVLFYSCCSLRTSVGAFLGWGSQRRCPFCLLEGHAVCFAPLLCHTLSFCL